MKPQIIIILILLCIQPLFAQKKKKEAANHLEKTSINALKWRSVGPALTSGRVSDIAVNQNNPFEYYVAIASGGVWKTSNWGLEYIPVFDNESSYSVGCVTIDPNNANTIWVGTGENNNQRSVAYGHGYRAKESIFHTLFEMDSWLEKYVKNKNIKPDDINVKIN